MISLFIFRFFVIFVLEGLLLSTGFATVIELGGNYGLIESPNYPRHYPTNHNKTWHISAPEGYQVVIYFTVFDLEDSYDLDLGGSCVYDYVKIENMGRTKRLCGNFATFPSDAPAPLQKFQSQNNSMTIEFVSDYGDFEGDVLNGFKAHYVIKDRDECKEMRHQVRTAFEDWDELVYCNHFCVNVPGSYYCSCRHGFVLHENNHTCKAVCEGEVLTDDEGFVASPDYPKPYSRLTDCDWTIRVRPGFSLNLQFEQKFAIENHFNYSECLYDYLKVEYGNNEETFCHDTPYNGQMIRTNTREVRLQFHTDNSIEQLGFRVNYTTTRQRCLATRNAPTNGRKTDNSKNFYEFEDEIVFSCDPGYNLVGEERTVCRINGTWSNPAPVCEIKVCGNPHFLENVPYSHLLGTENLNYTFRDNVTLRCNQWYELTSGLTEWKCSEDAEWVPIASESDASQVPVCSPICGKKNGEDRSLVGLHIAGGQRSNPNEWPWLVFIQLSECQNVAAVRWTCGGAIISPDYVLTAAHCITSSPFDFPPDGVVFPNLTHVWVGVHDRRVDRGGTTRARHVVVAEVIRHPNYNDSLNWDYDVALLHLGETIVMNDVVRPICLPNTAEQQALFDIGRTSGEVAGWGLFSIRELPSFVLRHAELPTVTNSTCWNSFTDTARQLNLTISPKLRLTENMFCAGFSMGGTGATCQGDSGGPYMVEDTSDKTYYTFGMVSFGLSATPCGNSVSYSGFAYLRPEIMQWINTQMERKNQKKIVK